MNSGIATLCDDVLAQLRKIVGALSRRRSRRQTRIVLVTMLAATAGTLAYRLPLMLHNQFGVDVVGGRVRAALEQFDPAVFGVLLSLVVFTALTYGARGLWGPAVEES